MQSRHLWQFHNRCLRSYFCRAVNMQVVYSDSICAGTFFMKQYLKSQRINLGKLEWVIYTTVSKIWGNSQGRWKGQRETHSSSMSGVHRRSLATTAQHHSSLMKKLTPYSRWCWGLDHGLDCGPPHSTRCYCLFTRWRMPPLHPCSLFVCVLPLFKLVCRQLGIKSTMVE